MAIPRLVFAALIDFSKTCRNCVYRELENIPKAGNDRFIGFLNGSHFLRKTLALRYYFRLVGYRAE